MLRQHLAKMLMVVTDAAFGFFALAIPFYLIGAEVDITLSGHLTLEAVTIVASLCMLAIYNGYTNLHRPVLDIAGAVILSLAVGGAIGGTTISLLGIRHEPTAWFLASLLVFMFFVIASRVLVSRQRKQIYYNQGTILICADDNQTKPSKQLDSIPAFFRITGVVMISDVLAANDKQLAGIIAGMKLAVISGDIQGETRQAVLERLAAMPIDVYVVPSLGDLLLHSSRIMQMSDVPFLTIKRLGLSMDSLILKRMMDIFGSVVLLLVFSPLFVLVPLANLLCSPGPTFYRQKRVGQGGKTYDVLKFRSMICNAEDKTGAVLATPNDDRVTPVGRVLRATRLDEIPQLINVLKGEMSLVGPRPERPVFVQQFAAENAHFRLRETVKPGLTGLAQVWGRYNTHPENKLRFDLLYITSYSFWLDIRIVLWTIQTVLWPQELVDATPLWITRLENGFVRRTTDVDAVVTNK